MQSAPGATRDIQVMKVRGLVFNQLSKRETKSKREVLHSIGVKGASLTEDEGQDHV